MEADHVAEDVIAEHDGERGALFLDTVGTIEIGGIENVPRFVAADEDPRAAERAAALVAAWLARANAERLGGALTLLGPRPARSRGSRGGGAGTCS